MKYDIVIIGAGPAGLSLAKSLASTPLQILMVEQAPLGSLESPAEDGREIALTHLSLKLLKEMEVWPLIPTQSVSPIKMAKVLSGNSSYCLEIDSKDAEVDALGYLVPNYRIREALYKAVQPLEHVTLLTETKATEVSTSQQSASLTLSNGEHIETGLIVAADSRFSETRRKNGISASMKDFGRVAIVSRMAHERPHKAVAYECFHYGRTLAILPLNGNVSSAVVTASADDAARILAMDDEQFAADVQQRFNSRLGKMTLASPRHSYPLVAVHANRFAKDRFALLGDAAVGMHPVTAHGFNLGLRGQHTLANEIKSALKQEIDFGSFSVLERYQKQHMRVTRPMYIGTNEIVNLFTNDSVPAKFARDFALRFSNNFPPVKRMIERKLTEVEGNSLLLPFGITW